MNKRFAAVLAAMAVAGVTSAFAANPFSDVTPNDWAYQSVAQLAQAGVINGYPDGTFKGQNSITRYEMAQMVAKAMANESRANAEQRAVINRLADEFSGELNTLGVRVSALENKVGNVKITGDARLRYQGASDKGVISETNTDKKSLFDYRGRIQFNAQVNDNTTAVARVVGEGEYGDSTANSVTFDRMYVNHKFGNHADVTLGRYGEFIGGGLIYDDTFDGAKATFGNDKYNLSASYGSMTWDGNNFGANNSAANADENPTMTIVQANAEIAPRTNLGGFYLFGNKNMDSFKLGDVHAADTDVYGVNLNSNLTDKVWVGGEWVKAKADNVEDTDAWVAGLGYGDYNLSKKGTWGVKMQYFDEGKNAPIQSSTFNQFYNNDYKGWMASVDYALADNVGLSANYGFAGEKQNGDDRSDFYRAELNYQF